MAPRVTQPAPGVALWSPVPCQDLAPLNVLLPRGWELWAGGGTGALSSDVSLLAAPRAGLELSQGSWISGKVLPPEALQWTVTPEAPRAPGVFGCPGWGCWRICAGTGVGFHDTPSSGRPCQDCVSILWGTVRSNPLPGLGRGTVSEGGRNDGADKEFPPNLFNGTVLALPPASKGKAMGLIHPNSRALFQIVIPNNLPIYKIKFKYSSHFYTKKIVFFFPLVKNNSSAGYRQSWGRSGFHGLSQSGGMMVFVLKSLFLHWVHRMFCKRFLKFSSSFTLVETLCARKAKGKRSSNIHVVNYWKSGRKGLYQAKLLGREDLEFQLNWAEDTARPFINSPAAF